MILCAINILILSSNKHTNHIQLSFIVNGGHGDCAIGAETLS